MNLFFIRYCKYYPAFKRYGYFIQTENAITWFKTIKEAKNWILKNNEVT